MKTHFTAVSIVALCAAAPALADVTAADVWAEMESNFASVTEAGGSYSADVTETGDGLVIDNMQFSTGGSVVTYDQMTLINRRDGTVELVLANPFNLSMQDSIGGAVSSFEAMIVTEGSETIISGDPDALTYSSVIESATFTMEGIDASSGDMVPMTVTMIMTGFDSSTGISGEEGARVMTGEGALAGMSFAMVIGGPDEKGNLTDGGTINFAINGVSLDFEGDYDAMLAWSAAMAEMDPTQPGNMPALYDFAFDMAYAGASFDLDFDADGTAVQGQGQNAGGEISISVGDALVYALGARNMTLAFSGDEIPFPVELAAAETGFDLTMPLVAGSEPSGMALGINYVDLTLGEQVWMMFDPGQAIPRDPATIRLDATGTVQLFSDLVGMDPFMLQGPPGEMRSLSINDLLISAAGAALSGSGSVEFTPGSFPPEPVGQVNLQLQGLNALTESLVAAGLVPADQIAMGTAMLGMFARPGAGPDTLESTIDFAPGGGIMANGVPLR